MPDTIRDGKGRGYLATVNEDQQLITRAINVQQRLHAAIDGNYYEVSTGLVTLTDALETAIIYIYNSDPNYSLVVDRIFYDTWASTNGSGVGTLEYYKNPTITGGTDVVPANTNFGDTGTLLGTFKKTPSTMTGTEWWWTPISPSTSTSRIEEGRFLLTQGSSFGITVQAPTGNTSMDININIAMYALKLSLVE